MSEQETGGGAPGAPQHDPAQYDAARHDAAGTRGDDSDAATAGAVTVDHATAVDQAADAEHAGSVRPAASDAAEHPDDSAAQSLDADQGLADDIDDIDGADGADAPADAFGAVVGADPDSGAPSGPAAADADVDDDDDDDDVMVLDTFQIQIPATGDAKVDAALVRLGEVEGLPPAQHAEVYAAVHAGLQDALADLDRA